MKKIDHSTATVGLEFTEGNPGTGTPATRVEAEWLNVIQAELVAVVEAASITLDQTGVDRDQVLEAINYLIAQSASSIPVGLVAPHSTDSVPTGWLACDGSAISRTTYADLFAEIGEEYGNGDGSTTFNIPDLRGEFIRGWDNGAGNDPDAASRTDRGDGTTGDNVGTKQADEIEAHTHGLNTSSGGDGPTNGLAAVSNSTTNGHQSGSHGGNETRPRNVAQMFIIKY